MRSPATFKENCLRTSLFLMVMTLALGAGLSSEPAKAQFVCDSDTLFESGEGATAAGSSSNFACGRDADASGTTSGNTATGRLAKAFGDRSFNTATGFRADASGTGPANTTFGRVAIGALANASGDSSNNVAIGFFAIASGTGSANTAVGANATATGMNSTAIGAGATATLANQMVFGTGSNTYTAPGITSPASLAAQTGPVLFVTSDALGNLATSEFVFDPGPIFDELDALAGELAQLDERTEEIESGVAIAMALEDPDLAGEESFGLKANYGNFEGADAFGVTAAGVLARDVFGARNRLTLSGGIGWGIEESTVGGRVGAQLSW